jgi:hypothetical protein
MADMTKIDLAMDERLMLVKYLTAYATDCGETLEDARAQAKQEINRIVNKGDVVSLSRIKARAICSQKGTQKQNQVKMNAGEVHISQMSESGNKRSSCSNTSYFANTQPSCDIFLVNKHLKCRAASLVLTSVSSGRSNDLSLALSAT